MGAIELDRMAWPEVKADIEAAVGAIFDAGVHSVAANGVIGDVAQASAEHGARYWEMVETIALTAIDPSG